MLLTLNVMQVVQDNFAILAPLFVIQLILMITALISLVKAEATNGPKWMWALIILLINTIGPIAYFIFGRRQDA
ncbi:PLD nuclease N-terminal domain-containing protein [Halobacillus sp. BBL2006]|uniref:PLD nuclease N-terminal domain-containing protein n=1 Tax=Halobacillus sp. BBL2006 TaxID=1543706 RepID=UPI000A56A977|nr:PLD nuclease N-terminal domain-containing protein [Halobacillus sp. BBL2006]